MFADSTLLRSEAARRFARSINTVITDLSTSSSLRRSSHIVRLRLAPSDSPDQKPAPKKAAAQSAHSIDQGVDGGARSPIGSGLLLKQGLEAVPMPTPTTTFAPASHRRPRHPRLQRSRLTHRQALRIDGRATDRVDGGARHAELLVGECGVPQPNVLPGANESGRATGGIEMRLQPISTAGAAGHQRGQGLPRLHPGAQG